MKPTNHEITLRLRAVSTPHLKKLPGLYPNDARALPLILSEINRRQRRAGGTTKLPTTTR